MVVKDGEEGEKKRMRARGGERRRKVEEEEGESEKTMEQRLAGRMRSRQG